MVIKRSLWKRSTQWSNSTDHSKSWCSQKIKALSLAGGWKSSRSRFRSRYWTDLLNWLHHGIRLMVIRPNHNHTPNSSMINSTLNCLSLVLWRIHFLSARSWPTLSNWLASDVCLITCELLEEDEKRRMAITETEFCVDRGLTWIACGMVGVEINRNYMREIKGRLKIT